VPLLAAVRLRVSRDAAVRREAVVELAGAGGWAALSALRQALGDPDAEVRAVAVEALGRLGDRRAVPALSALAGDARGSERDRVLVALAQIADPRCLEILARALSPGKSMSLPGEAALVAIAANAARFGDARAVMLLPPLLINPHRTVSRAAARALVAAGWTPETPRERAALLVAQDAWDTAASHGADALDPLLAALWDDSGGVQREAAQALGRVGPAALPRLLPLLTTFSPALRAAAGDALAAIGSASIEPLLMAAGDDKVKPRAFEALRKMGDPGVRGTSAWLTARQPAMRARAAEALGVIGGSGAVEPLRRALTDESADVRLQVARALRALGGTPSNAGADGVAFAIAAQAWSDVAAMGERAADSLAARLGEPAIRLRVIQTLGQIGGARATAALAGLAEGTEEYARRAAIEALITQRDARALPPLLRQVRDLEPGFLPAQRRVDAVRALQRFGGPQAEAALIDALSDAAHDVRRAAADALDALAWTPATPEQTALRLVARADWAGVVALGAVAGPALAPAIAHDDLAIGFPAAEALAAIGEAHHVPAPLRLGLAQRDRAVRRRAIDALAKVRDPQGLADVAATLADDDEVVARHAADALAGVGVPAIDALAEVLPLAGRRAARLAAATLGRIGDPRAVPPLIAALGGAAAVEAASALGVLGDRRAVDPLIAALAGPWEAASAAASALGRLDDPRALGPLLARLPRHAGYHSVHANPIVHAITRLAPLDLDTPLAALDLPEAPLWALALIFGACREPRAVQRLIAGLPGASDADADAIATGLGQMGDRRAAPALSERLDAGGGAAMVQALVALGDARGIEPLLGYARRVRGSRYDEYNGIASLVPEAVSAVERLLDASAADAPDASLEAAAAFPDLYEMVWHMVNGCTRGEYPRDISCAAIRQRARQELIRRRASAGAGAGAL
jgi:HEAT repeat protein